MNQEEEYLIHELAEMSGVSVRTIRYYIAEGLLPAPDTKGRYATFNEDYRQRLELIRRLKEAFLPLKEIRDRIIGLDPSQVQEMLSQLPAEPYENKQNFQFSIAEQTPEDRKQQPLSSALDYLSQVMGVGNQSRPQMRSEKFSLPRPPKPRDMATGEVETWQRIVLAPGLELNIRSTEEPFYRERIRQLIEFAKIQFS